MYTECPNCSTVFRVQPGQLAAAGGRVRCGDCLAVFDAREYRRDDLEEPPEPPAARVPASPPDAQGSLRLEAPDPVREDPSAPLPVEPPPAPARPARPPRAPAPRRHPNPGFPLPFDADFEPPTPPKRGLWTAAGLLLLVALGAQYLWFDRLALSQVPALQPAVTAVCRLLPCGLEALPDPQAFELTGRSVQSHPSFETALLVDLTFQNRTPLPRPYPGLELVFTDLEGNPVASRRFAPAEYLGSPPQQPLAAGAEAHGVLELLDPGDLAAGYEFRFF